MIGKWYNNNNKTKMKNEREKTMIKTPIKICCHYKWHNMQSYFMNKFLEAIVQFLLPFKQPPRAVREATASVLVEILYVCVIFFSAIWRRWLTMQFKDKRKLTFHSMQFDKWLAFVGAYPFRATQNSSVSFLISLANGMSRCTAF